MDHLAPEQLDVTTADLEVEPAGAETLLDRRIDAAAAALGGDQRGAIVDILASIDDDDRAAIWLAAHEWNYRDDSWPDSPNRRFPSRVRGPPIA